MENLENKQELKEEDSSPWPEYYATTAENPPHRLLVESLEFLTKEGKVLDLGAGSGMDSRYLSEQGYVVTAVDSDPAAAQYFQGNQDSKITFMQSSFTEYDFPKDEFILVNAQYALPFIRDKQELAILIDKIKNALTSEGIFVGQLFGDRDDWSKGIDPLACVTRSEAEAFFSDMEMIRFSEENRDGKVATGSVKHWHVFHVIAQKK